MMSLGFIKLGFSLLFGSSLQELCEHFPASVLGTLLGWSGLELAISALRKPPTQTNHSEEGVPITIGDEEHDRELDMIVLLVTAGFELALKSGVAFIAGCAFTALLRFASVSSRTMS